jgi:hypothetical protein
LTSLHNPSESAAALLDGIRAFIEPTQVRAPSGGCLRYGRDRTRLYHPNPLAEFRVNMNPGKIFKIFD